MKHLLKVTGEINSADYDRILLTEDGSVISQLGGGVKPIEYEAVDLGLPSGTKWCNMNVGATSPEDGGLYFAWGETQGYTVEQVGTGEGQKTFEWDNYKFSVNGSWSIFTKYSILIDEKSILDPEDDAAHVIMGGDWRMPTQEDFVELINNTTNEMITVNNGNSYGRVFTSKVNGNSIFIPAAGCISGSMYINNEGFLWSSSLYYNSFDNAWYLYFNSRGVNANTQIMRAYGLPIRAVLI